MEINVHPMCWKHGILSAFVALSLIIAAWISAECSENTARSINSATAAFDRVLQYTGLDREILLPEGRNLDERAEKVVMSDTTVDFARKHIHDRTAWRLSFQDVLLPVTEGVMADGWVQIPHTVEFWIDSSAGLLLLVRSVRQDDEESCEPPWSEVFSPHGLDDETFWRVSTKLPKIALKDAVGRCDHKPFAAKAWSAAHLVYSTRGGTPLEAWIMNFSGLPTISPGAGVPIPYARIVIDASTGGVLTRTGYAIDTTMRPESGE